MIKITKIFKDDKTVILKVDGQVAGKSVSSLEKECIYYRSKAKKTVILDFSGVTFIDNKGVRMLERIKDKKTKIVNCSLFIEELLQNIITGDKK
ncbi:hypothetical protein HRbin37_01435 [bacterium HR37]|nr:hypothetical protein HRbin37_01435 [bacterium HR37]